MKKRIYFLLGIILIFIIIIGGYLYQRYEKQYINGVNPYQKEINIILGINEPIFNSRNPKNALKPVYGAIVNAYECKTYQSLSTIVSMNNNNDDSIRELEIAKKQVQEAKGLIEKNQEIMKKMIEFSEKNSISYLNVNQFKEFYASIQNVINSNFNIETIKTEENKNANFFTNKEFKEISQGYAENIQKTTKIYPNLKREGKYYLVIWNNAFIAFSNKNINEIPKTFDTVNVE